MKDRLVGMKIALVGLALTACTSPQPEQVPSPVRNLAAQIGDIFEPKKSDTPPTGSITVEKKIDAKYFSVTRVDDSPDTFRIRAKLVEIRHPLIGRDVGEAYLKNDRGCVEKGVFDAFPWDRYFEAANPECLPELL